MNTGYGCEHQWRTKLSKCGFSGAVALLLLLPVGAWAGGVVTNCTEAALRAAMAGGGVVTFACDGTILLASTITNASDTTLDGSGRQVTISGNKAVRVFSVNSGVRFAVLNLTIADGRSLGGSAILNLDNAVSLTGVTIRSNTAALVDNDALSPNGRGGAIYNLRGSVSATNCTFVGNTAQSSGNGPIDVLAWGGAIVNDSGQVDLRSCAFVGNQASGGRMASSGTGDPGQGGAIYNGGTMTLDLCTLAGNSATGGDGIGPQMGYPGGMGAEASGGAIFNLGLLTADRTTLSGNIATGGAGGGGGGPAYGDSSLDGFPGGDGGAANGAAIWNGGRLYVTRSTLASNVVTGGAGGWGGGGGSFISEYGGNGAGAGNGASGLGGALFNLETASLVNCTVAFNIGSGGAGGRGGYGGPGGHWGGAGGAGGNGGSGFADIDGMCNLVNCTVAWNRGNAGAGGAGGAGGSSAERPGAPGPNGTSGSASGGAAVCPMVNTLLASNAPAINDSFTNPKLGPLADNGGPTLTLALLPGSPAIDAGNTSLAPATDQRGFPRPAGLAADIGAFEYNDGLLLTMNRPGGTGVDILAWGNAGSSCRLLSSADLLSWVPIATNQIGPNGTVLFDDTCAPGGTCRFYRLVMP